ncbi:MAG TPA: nitroreductase [Gammaproteobacteria bacterium]
MNSAQSPLDAGRIRSLLGYAILAPSSHNTQPWRFRINGNAVSLYADRSRALPVNDPHDRELSISCGCALMNLRVAAAHEGLGTSCEIAPDETDKDLLARVSFNLIDTSTPPGAELFDAIEDRRTCRKRFEPDDVPEPLLNALAAAAAQEACWLEVIESEENRHACAALVAEGDSMQWSNPDWRQELASWMHTGRDGDGLTVPGVVAPIAQAVVRTFDMGNGVAAKDRQLADESPLLAVLGTSGDTLADWLAAGQALQKVLLTAQSRGLQASYLNQPIQLEALRPRLQNLMAQPGFPQILLRLGFASDEIEATPRRLLDEVVDEVID